MRKSNYMGEEALETTAYMARASNLEDNNSRIHGIHEPATGN